MNFSRQMKFSRQVVDGSKLVHSCYFRNSNEGLYPLHHGMVTELIPSPTLNLSFRISRLLNGNLSRKLSKCCLWIMWFGSLGTQSNIQNRHMTSLLWYAQYRPNGVLPTEQIIFMVRIRTIS